MLGGGEALPDSDCNGGAVVATRKFDLPFKVGMPASPQGCIPPHAVVPPCLHEPRHLPPQVRTLAGPLAYVLVVSTITAAYHALAAVRAALACRGATRGQEVWREAWCACGGSAAGVCMPAPAAGSHTRQRAAPQAGKVPPASWATMLGNNAPFQLTSFALSLLLVFRTNARWARRRGGRTQAQRRGHRKGGVCCSLSPEACHPRAAPSHAAMRASSMRARHGGR